MRLRQGGAGLVIVVSLIVTVAAFAVVVAAGQMASNVQGNDAQADSVEALLLAESGIERALKRYATGVANCGLTPTTLDETITDLTQLGLGAASGRTIRILTGDTTDFSNPAVNLFTATQCRVRVTATINASRVSRTLHAIVDRNLLRGANNHNFNNPTTAVAPAGWTRNPNVAGTYAQNGGPEGLPPCNRSVRLWKSNNNNNAAARTVTSGTTAIPTVPAVTVTNPSTTTVHFHWRVVDRSGNGACGAAAAGPAFPCGGAGTANADGQVCFQLTSTAGGPWTSARRDINPGPTAPATACGAAFASPCSTSYQIPSPPVYSTKDTLTIAHTANVTLNGFFYWMRLQNTGFREMWLDNIEAVNPTALNAARVQVWRDCSAVADPVNCV